MRVDYAAGGGGLPGVWEGAGERSGGATVSWGTVVKGGSESELSSGGRVGSLSIGNSDAGI
jgi:hypothetical protein